MAPDAGTSSSKNVLDESGSDSSMLKVAEQTDDDSSIKEVPDHCDSDSLIKNVPDQNDGDSSSKKVPDQNDGDSSIKKVPEQIDGDSVVKKFSDLIEQLSPKKKIKVAPDNDSSPSGDVSNVGNNQGQHKGDAVSETNAVKAVRDVPGSVSNDSPESNDTVNNMDSSISEDTAINESQNAENTSQKTIPEKNSAELNPGSDEKGEIAQLNDAEQLKSGEKEAPEAMEEGSDPVPTAESAAASSALEVK